MLDDDTVVAVWYLPMVCQQDDLSDSFDESFALILSDSQLTYRPVDLIEKLPVSLSTELTIP